MGGDLRARPPTPWSPLWESRGQTPNNFCDLRQKSGICALSKIKFHSLAGGKHVVSRFNKIQLLKIILPSNRTVGHRAAIAPFTSGLELFNHLIFIRVTLRSRMYSTTQTTSN